MAYQFQEEIELNVVLTFFRGQTRCFSCLKPTNWLFCSFFFWGFWHRNRQTRKWHLIFFFLNSREGVSNSGKKLLNFFLRCNNNKNRTRMRRLLLFFCWGQSFFFFFQKFFKCIQRKGCESKPNYLRLLFSLLLFFSHFCFLFLTSQLQEKKHRTLFFVSQLLEKGFA